MRITHKKNALPFDYRINNVTLAEVTEYKYLGLWVTNNLSWNKHIDFITCNAFRKLFFLRRALRLSTPSVRLLAYKCIVLPTLDYAAVIWDPFTKTNINKVEKVQKRAARYIYNNYRRTSVTHLLIKAGLPTINERNRSARLKFMYQIIKGHYRTELTHLIHFSSGYATRQRHQLSLTPFRTRNNCFKYSFLPRTITDWNNLTNNEVLQPSLTLFAEHIT